MYKFPMNTIKPLIIFVLNSHKYNEIPKPYKQPSWSETYATLIFTTNLDPPASHNHGRQYAARNRSSAPKNYIRIIFPADNEADEGTKCKFLLVGRLYDSGPREGIKHSTAYAEN